MSIGFIRLWCTSRPVSGPGYAFRRARWVVNTGRSMTASAMLETSATAVTASTHLLLEAALDEFAAKGFSGARVAEIAARAGVNRQLISYYFGGKEGLYRELQRLRLSRESALTETGLPLAETVTRYLHEVLADPRLLRLGVWRGLTDSPQPAADDFGLEELSRTRARQSTGELAADLDPAAVMLLLIGAVTVPVTMPQLIGDIFGTVPSDPDFESAYAEQLRRVIERLALPAPDEDAQR